jgi:hypothetical protein
MDYDQVFRQQVSVERPASWNTCRRRSSWTRLQDLGSRTGSVLYLVPGDGPQGLTLATSGNLDG